MVPLNVVEGIGFGRDGTGMGWEVRPGVCQGTERGNESQSRSCTHLVFFVYPSVLYIHLYTNTAKLDSGLVSSRILARIP